MTTQIIFGALAYIIPTFALAYFWHLKWFKSLYEKWAYAEKPSIPLGFASIGIQGIVLSTLYALAPIAHNSLVSALILMSGFAVFHWTVHVLALMAKSHLARNWGYFLLETFYLTFQFGIFAILISTIVY
jgi:hypothetical protein